MRTAMQGVIKMLSEVAPGGGLAHGGSLETHLDTDASAR